MTDLKQDQPKQTIFLSNNPPAPLASPEIYLRQADKEQPVELLIAPKPQIENRYALPAMTHNEICRRVHEKNTKVLAFLKDGEIWSCMSNVSHILKLSVRQTQATLANMVENRLLKVDEVDGLRIYGISQTGAAYLNPDELSRVFSVGKTPPTTIQHHRVCQKVRIELESYYGVKDFVSGKFLYKKKYFRNVPDCLFKSAHLTVAGEIELTVKSMQDFKAVLTNYCKDFCAFDEQVGGLHKVVYFTPHPQAIRTMINKFVPDEYINRFHVHQIDRNIPPYSNDLKFVDKNLDRFLNRI